MIRLHKNKYAGMLLLSIISTIISLGFIVMIGVYDICFKGGTTTSTLPIEFPNIALGVALAFCVLLLIMLIKHKSFNKFDFLAIIILIILWFATTLNYTVMCTSMQFPKDTDTLQGFYGFFLRHEVVRSYRLEIPITSRLVSVNFEISVSIICTIISSILFICQRRRKKQLTKI